jgi:dCMP deaminase
MVAVASYAALRSPDPSTQNAAVLYDEFGVCSSTYAVNEFPRGVHETNHLGTSRWERPGKYMWVEHAERNSIYKAARLGISTAGATMVCPWAACADCARGIIQAGFGRLVTMQYEISGRWDESIDAGFTMLAEAGVKVEFIDGPLGVKVRRNGKVVEI